MKGGHEISTHHPAFDKEALMSGVRKKSPFSNLKLEPMSPSGLEANFAASEKARIAKLRN